jgi:hypothetical protein
MTSKTYQKKYAKLLKETRDLTVPILDRLLEKDDTPEAGEIVGEDGIIYEPCGTFEEIPDLDPVEIADAQKSTENIVTEVEENPFEYPEASEARGQNAPGDGLGESREKITLASIGKPAWVRELKGLVKGYGKPTRKRSKDYYDIESLVRGVPEKESAKKKKRGDLVFTIVDTSGSMMQRSVTGQTYLKELMKYVQPIVEDYDGEVVIGDVAPRVILPNKYARKALKESQSLSAAGGGGTSFDRMFDYIIQRKRQEKFECLVIVLSDGGVIINPAQIQELGSCIMVIPKNEKATFESLNKGTMMTMFQSNNFPLVRLLSLDFRTE